MERIGNHTTKLKQELYAKIWLCIDVKIRILIIKDIAFPNTIVNNIGNRVWHNLKSGLYKEK